MWPGLISNPFCLSQQESPNFWPFAVSQQMPIGTSQAVTSSVPGPGYPKCLSASKQQRRRQGQGVLSRTRGSEGLRDLRGQRDAPGRDVSLAPLGCPALVRQSPTKLPIVF